MLAMLAVVFCQSVSFGAPEVAEEAAAVTTEAEGSEDGGDADADGNGTVPQEGEPAGPVTEEAAAE